MAIAERRRVAVAASLEQRLSQLERLLGPGGRYALLRVRANDFECRILAGDVGRGETAAAAVGALVEELTS